MYFGLAKHNVQFIDVNECLSGHIGNTTCLEVCVNTPGSWRCDCNPGYTLNADGASCRGIYYVAISITGMQYDNGTCILSDVNECEGMNQCDHLCNNTVGSYTCSCNPNISVVLNPDGYRCDGMHNHVVMICLTGRKIYSV